MKLHQLIAAEKDKKAAADRDVTTGYHTLQKSQLFGGFTKKYAPAVEDGTQLPPEGQRLQAKVPDVLERIGNGMTRIIDLAATKDTTNQGASAPVKVNGADITSPLPVSTLLFLEKQLVHIRTIVDAIPVLPADEEWTADEVLDCWVSEAAQTLRQVTVTDYRQIAPATDKHAAQMVEVKKPVVEDTWTTVKFSGAVPAWRKQVLRGRVDTLIVAVKTAREEANQADVADVRVGAAIMDYLFG